MKRLRTPGLALLAPLALGLLVCSVAFGAEGIAPLGKKGFTLNGGAVTLENVAGEVIKCEKVKGEGAFKNGQEGTGVLDLEGCVIFGSFAINSLGDLSKVILEKIVVTVCLVTPSALLFGIVIRPEETQHLEVPSLGALLLLKGSVIAHNLSGGGPSKEFEVDLAGSKGVQKQALSCEIEGKKFTHNLEFAPDSSSKDDNASESVVKLVIAFKELEELVDA
jgi:hypothetical protein